MKVIQVLGPGCPKCKKLAQSVEAVIAETGVEAKMEKVTDINQILDLGVMMTPALAIDGEVKVVGKVPSAEEIKGFLT